MSFAAMSLLVWGVYQLLAFLLARRRILDRARQSGQAPEPGEEEERKPEALDRIKDRSVRLMDAIGRRVVKEDSADYGKAMARFVRAGLRSADAPKLFWGAKGLLFFSPALLWVLLKLVSVWQPVIMPAFYWFYGLAVLGYFAPDLWLRVRTKRRRDLLFQGFPEALDLLVVCVEAGMGMDNARRNRGRGAGESA